MSDVVKYGLSVEFERIVVALTCQSPRFYGTTARHLDPEAMSCPEARLAVEACHAHAKERGSGPSATTVVVQRLNRWAHEGRTTVAEITDVDEYVAAAEDAGLPPADDVTAELAYVLRRRKQSEALIAATEDFGKRRDMGRARQMLAEADNIGLVEKRGGATMGTEASVDLIRALLSQDYLPTGIEGLDVVLGGGMPRGKLGVLIGGSGSGKSIGLGQIAASAWRLGHLCCYATLELDVATVHARMIAAVTGWRINDVMLRPEEAIKAIPFAEVQDVLRDVQATQVDTALGGRQATIGGGFAGVSPVGKIEVAEFTPQATTVPEIVAWANEVAEREGRPVGLLAVDYADKLAPAVASKEKGTYKAAGEIYEDLRINAHETRTWCWTASAATRRDKRQKKRLLDTEDAADSINKIRVCDLAITLNPSEDFEEITLFVGKNRVGKSRVTIGPLPTDYECGMLAYAVRGDGETPF